jgi:hypothetical protein
MRTFYTLCIIGFLTSCAAITKHGPAVKETRQVAAFSRIHAESAFEIDFTSGSSTSLIVEAPDDLVGKIKTEVNNGTLEISIKGEINNVEQPIKIHLQSASLEAANLQGACRLDLLSTLNGTDFRLDLSGASSFRGTIYMKNVIVNMDGAATAEIGGMTNRFTANVSGASTLNADKFSSVVANVKADGASNASILADSSLDAEANGAATISYKGNPVIVGNTTDGAGNISKEK